MKTNANEADRERHSSATRQREHEQASAAAQHDEPGRHTTGQAARVASLHRAVGNQTAQTLLDPDDRESPSAGPGRGPTTPPAVQPKLTVSEPDDRQETEAKRVAERVLRMSDPTATVTTRDESPAPEHVQRLCSRCRRRYARRKPLNCDECEAELQRSATAEGAAAAPTIDAATQRWIQSLRGGTPLSEDLRSFFEPRFGRDFGDVSVHTGSRADAAARSISAEAFTVGDNIVFRSGAYRPETRAGKRLLAHELTHVVQQTDPASLGMDRPVSLTEHATAEAASAQSGPAHGGTPSDRPSPRSATHGDELSASDVDSTATASRPAPLERSSVATATTPAVQRQFSGFGSVFQLGGQLVGKTWLNLSRGMKERLVDTALNLAVESIHRFPGRQLLGSLWPMFRAGLLGFYRTLQQAETAVKITAMDNIATIMAGENVQFAKAWLIGFLKGFFVDGLFGIFVAIYELCTNLDKLWSFFDAIGEMIGAFPDRIRSMIEGFEALGTQVVANFSAAMNELWSLLTDPTELAGLLQAIAGAAAGHMEAIGQRAAQQFLQFFASDRAAGALGSISGRLMGVAVFEIVAAVFTGGISGAVAAVKIATRLVAKVGGKILGSVLKIVDLLKRVFGVVVDVVRKAARFVKGRILGTLSKQLADLLDDIRDFMAMILRRCTEKSPISCDFTVRTQRLLAKLRVPRWAPHPRNLNTSIDPKLVEKAKEIRATQAGVTREAFERNVAVARVRVNGQTRYLSAGNLRSGPHSEQYLDAQIQTLKGPDKTVVLEQLYSERIPCTHTCGPLLQHKYPNADIFFSTRQKGAAAVRELMQRYGLAD